LTSTKTKASANACGEAKVGDKVGAFEGTDVGEIVGNTLGDALGRNVGELIGGTLGYVVKNSVGKLVGGAVVGSKVGSAIVELYDPIDP
jgi:hypothetical protein